MDYHNRAGSKKGSGGVASSSLENRNRRERLRQLALETINLDKDPYIFKNHLGTFECKLCLTVHVSDASYLSHTQGRKHQTNLARRQVLEDRENERRTAKSKPAGPNSTGLSNIPKRKIIRIGRPQYRVSKIRDRVTRQIGLSFQLSVPKLAPDITPHYRLMSAFEQQVDTPPDKKFQYLVVAAEPYTNCAFKIENKPIDQSPGKCWSYYDQDTQKYYVQFFFADSPN